MNTEREYATYLDDSGLKEIQKLEKELGSTLLAFATPGMPAQLSAEQLTRVQQLEQKLCVRLVALAGH